MTKKTTITFLLIGCIIVGAYVFSPFRFLMPGESAHFNDSPALTADELITQAALKRHIHMLSETIGERNVENQERLIKTENYIASEFKQLNLSVSLHTYRADGFDVSNIIAEKKGTDANPEILIIGGHYDSVIGSKGANDNASGIAAVMELARLLSKTSTKHTIRFVGFVNEEPPFFQTQQMGSMVYAKKLQQDDEKIAGMLSIETIGSYYNQRNSQYYPSPLDLLYPDTGNFVAFVANPNSKALLYSTIKNFREHVDFPSEGLVSPENIPGVSWSDHWSFWQAGYPAIMVTDTALYRYEHYHTDDDTIDKINFTAMTQVVAGLAKVIQELDKQL